jgi:hypothetical protein
VTKDLYNRRYVVDQPVECVVFHHDDGTVTIVRLRPQQMRSLAGLLNTRADLLLEQGVEENS